MTNHSRIAEISVAIAGIASGVAIAFVLPLPVDAYYWHSVLILILLQIVFLAPFLLFRVALHTVAGIAFALAAYLAFFEVWLFFRPAPFAFVRCLLSLPGGLVGAFLSVYWLRNRSAVATAVVTTGTAAISTFSGLLLSLLMVSDLY